MQTTSRRPRPRDAGSSSPHEPQRTCVGCRSVRPQHVLVRVVADGRGGVAVSRRRASGRGAYLCPSSECVGAALRRNVLPRALRAELPRLDAASLRQQMAIETNRREVRRGATAGARSRRSH